MHLFAASSVMGTAASFGVLASGGQDIYAQRLVNFLNSRFRLESDEPTLKNAAARLISEGLRGVGHQIALLPMVHHKDPAKALQEELHKGIKPADIPAELRDLKAGDDFCIALGRFLVSCLSEPEKPTVDVAPDVLFVLQSTIQSVKTYQDQGDLKAARLEINAIINLCRGISDKQERFQALWLAAQSLEDSTFYTALLALVHTLQSGEVDITLLESVAAAKLAGPDFLKLANYARMQAKRRRSKLGVDHTVHGRPVVIELPPVDLSEVKAAAWNDKFEKAHELAKQIIDQTIENLQAVYEEEQAKTPPDEKIFIDESALIALMLGELGSLGFEGRSVLIQYAISKLEQTEDNPLIRAELQAVRLFEKELAAQADQAAAEEQRHIEAKPGAKATLPSPSYAPQVPSDEDFVDIEKIQQAHDRKDTKVTRELSRQQIRWTIQFINSSSSDPEDRLNQMLAFVIEELEFLGVRRQIKLIEFALLETKKIDNEAIRETEKNALEALMAQLWKKD